MPNQTSVEHLNSLLADLQNRRTQLLAKFRPDDRNVQETDQEIADTQAALDKAMKLTGLEQSTDVNPVHQTLEIEMAKEQSALAGVEARRNTLAQQTQNYHAQLLNLGNATTAYDDLARNRKEAEENYLLYTKKTEEARIAESLDQQKIANVAIAETPTEPHLPSQTQRPSQSGPRRGAGDTSASVWPSASSISMRPPKGPISKLSTVSRPNTIWMPCSIPPN